MKHILVISCLFLKQTCGNFLILIDKQTSTIYTCNTVNMECNLASPAQLVLLRETATCSKIQLIDPVLNQKCEQ